MRSYENYIAREEELNYIMCISNAQANGIDAKEAMECDAKTPKCNNCPFVRENKNGCS